MAEVKPLPALHFDPRVAGPIGRLIAPPYDVIDEAERTELLAGSAHNVVALDLPRDPAGGDPYRQADDLLKAWTKDGILTVGEPAMMALSQTFKGPDGTSRTRHSILARVRVEQYGAGRIRAHERTQPGPKQDRLDLTRATRHNLSPIFSLTAADAWPAVAEATAGPPWAEFTGSDGVENSAWWIEDPQTHRDIGDRLTGAELLIADGHHRYETARAYAEEIGGEGPHNYTLMALTSLQDPGLTVFPTHRLLTGLSDEDLLRLDRGLRDAFECEEVARDDLTAAVPGVGVFGYSDSRGSRYYRLHLRNRVFLDQRLGERSLAYRELDSVVLETVVLKGILGMTERDIADKRGLGYAKSQDQVDRMLRHEGYQAAFLLRPTPVDQVREVAGAGEIMPPKSTYFFPKIPTGLLFNPLSGTGT